MTQAAFIPGTELARRYWHDVVAPIVDELLPGVPRAAARIGAGSDVLGFDTERSTDHGWGPRVTVFFEDSLDLARDRRARLLESIDKRIPAVFLGYPTRFAPSDDSAARHQVILTNVREWFTQALGFDPRGEITDADWLAAPAQLLLEATAGAVFEDGHGELTIARERLTWYPNDVWLYLLGCQWRRIDQEEPFAGRAAEVGDDLGSSVIAARLVRDVMRLCFLIERRYAPYTKWLGTAFNQLGSGPTLMPMLREALAAKTWHAREDALVPAYEHVARMFNALGVTEPQEAEVRYFYNRPFRVLDSGRFVEACMERTPLKRLGYKGGIDQFADNTDVLSDALTPRRLLQEFWLS
ncbi:MAG TPA: DUF4037 domain-containing protein [Dehalococcoidia bacterium]